MKKWVWVDGPIWRYAKTGIDGNTELFGVNIFQYEWESAGQSVPVQDPHYYRDYRFPVYEATIDGARHTFAAGEFSNGVWGFYLPYLPE